MRKHLLLLSFLFFSFFAKALLLFNKINKQPDATQLAIHSSIIYKLQLTMPCYDMIQLAALQKKLFSFKEKKGVEKIIAAEQILYAKACGSYTDLYYEENDKLLKTTLTHRLAIVQTHLIDIGFERLHKSNLVNMRRIKTILWNDGTLKLTYDIPIYFAEAQAAIIQHYYTQL